MNGKKNVRKAKIHMYTSMIDSLLKDFIIKVFDCFVIIIDILFVGLAKEIMAEYSGCQISILFRAFLGHGITT